MGKVRMGKVCSIDELLKELKNGGPPRRCKCKKVCARHSQKSKIIVASGGLDPIHRGHSRYITEAAKLHPNSILIVIINSDEWLKRKKGFVFMPAEERMEIVAAIQGVDYVVEWDDGTPTVSGAIKIIKPDIFAKGGDRDAPEKIPEFDVCSEIGCEVVFGVGGGKIQSSSTLVEKATEVEISE